MPIPNTQAETARCNGCNDLHLSTNLQDMLYLVLCPRCIDKISKLAPAPAPALTQSVQALADEARQYANITADLATDVYCIIGATSDDIPVDAKLHAAYVHFLKAASSLQCARTELIKYARSVTDV